MGKAVAGTNAVTKDQLWDCVVVSKSVDKGEKLLAEDLEWLIGFPLMKYGLPGSKGHESLVSSDDLCLDVNEGIIGKSVYVGSGLLVCIA